MRSCSSVRSYHGCIEHQFSHTVKAPRRIHLVERDDELHLGAVPRPVALEPHHGIDRDAVVCQLHRSVYLRGVRAIVHDLGRSSGREGQLEGLQRRQDRRCRRKALATSTRGPGVDRASRSIRHRAARPDLVRDAARASSTSASWLASRALASACHSSPVLPPLQATRVASKAPSKPMRDLMNVWRSA